jgi:hypothetical protein
MLSSGTSQTETIIANTKHFKKTVVVNGKSTVVPGYGDSMCMMIGIIAFTGIKFVVMLTEWVFISLLSPDLANAHLKRVCPGTVGYALRIIMLW